jgi:hypothetical protein
VTFGIVMIVVLAVGGGYLALRAADRATSLQPTPATAADRALSVEEVRSVPHIAFRSTALGPTYGKLAAVPIGDPAGDRAVTDLDCDRVYAVTTAGLCVAADRGVVTTYRLVVLDASLEPVADETLNGLPSRTRLATDGSLAATTMFVSGHSYAGGAFSTETTIFDLASGSSLGNVQDWSVVIEGEESAPVDLNVWGVTFTPGPRPETFYATVASGGRTWLAEGNLADRRLETFRGGVECPSMSPDGTRVAFKKRGQVDGALGWRLAVLDLESGEETVLAERRSVDDQPEWLDDRTILYGLQREASAEADVWAVPADGSGEPEVLVPRAWSPAVVR